MAHKKGKRKRLTIDQIIWRIETIFGAVHTDTRAERYKTLKKLIREVRKDA